MSYFEVALNPISEAVSMVAYQVISLDAFHLHPPIFLVEASAAQSPTE